MIEKLRMFLRSVILAASGTKLAGIPPRGTFGFETV